MIKSIINIINVSLELLKNLFNSLAIKSRLKDVEEQQKKNKELDEQIDNNISNKNIDGLNEQLGFKASSNKRLAKLTVDKKTETVSPEPKKRGRKKKSQ
jgi:hypothetical protein